MITSKKPDEADVHIGRRVKERRTKAGLSQEQLGERLGITFQQVQKYEKGMNRIGAGRLYGIARALVTPVAFFYEGLEEPARPAKGLSEGNGQPALTGRRELSGEAAKLVDDFGRIPDPLVRRSVLDLVNALASDRHKPTLRPAPRDVR